MAEGLARTLLLGRDVYSAGSVPTSPHPMALKALKLRGIDASAQKSTAASDIDPASVDLVVTLCADEVCPAFLGAKDQLHWPLEDPAGHDESEAQMLARFVKTRDAIESRIRETLMAHPLLRSDTVTKR